MKKGAELTKENLITAFWYVYKNNSLNHINIKLITDKAGYNRSTFYSHFNDVYDLLSCAEDQLIIEMIEKLESAVKNWNSTEMLSALAETYDTLGPRLSLLLGPYGDPIFLKKYREALIPTVIRAFQLPKDNDVIILACEYAIGAVTATLTKWYLDGKTIPADSLAKLLQNLSVVGVVSFFKNPVGF